MPIVCILRKEKRMQAISVFKWHFSSLPPPIHFCTVAPTSDNVPYLFALILLLNNVIHYLPCIFIYDLENFDARCILFTLFLSKALFLSLLSRGYFKKCKKAIIVANTKR